MIDKAGVTRTTRTRDENRARVEPLDPDALRAKFRRHESIPLGTIEEILDELVAEREAREQAELALANAEEVALLWRQRMETMRAALVSAHADRLPDPPDRARAR